MRLVPSQGSFLRFYILLALALCCVLLIALGGRAFIEQLRREDYLEQLAELPMSLITRRLAELPADERDVALARFAEQLGMSAELVSSADSDLGYFESSRLQRGRVLIDESPWRLRKLLPVAEVTGRDLLIASLPDWSERLWLGSAKLLGEWLAQMPGDTRRATLDKMAQDNWPLRLLDSPPDDLLEGQRRELAQGEVVTRLAGDSLAITLLYRLPGEAQWLQAGPMSRRDKLPLNLHIPLLLAILLILSLIIYLIMRSIETRMDRLELAATRIASGRLETRVKVESGDFFGRLGMAFNGMANQVQSLLRGQQEMIRAVSHELRTPVARIRFAVQMVEDMTEQPAIRRQLQGIDTDIAELDDLIDEILTYARLGGDTINGAELEMALVDCRALVERVREILTPLHQSVTLTIEGDSELELWAEPRHLQRAVQNLVSNACRYGNTHVLIRMHNEPHLVRIDVEDDGPGIPAQARSEVFKPFTRLDDSRARSSGGYGLGLSIVEKIMDGHKGSVTVDTSPRLGGARFTLLIPHHEWPV